MIDIVIQERTIEDRIYLRNMADRWTDEIGKAESAILFFSPYLTSQTAENIILSAKDLGHCEVYTHFDCEEFVRGSSSIDTLRALSKEGVDLYELPMLHAKIVIVKGAFASIGSQNLTYGGTIRQEGSYATTDELEVQRIWEDALAWCTNRQRITPAMIDSMKNNVDLLQEEYSQFKAHCDEANKNARAKRHRSATSARWNSTTSKSREKIPVRVVLNEQGRYPHYQLEPISKEADLTRWHFSDGNHVKLDRLFRYPCLINETWRLGFARVAQTRITYVAQDVGSTDTDNICGWKLKWNSEAVWSDNLTDHNVICSITIPTQNLTLNIKGWFGLDTLELHEPCTSGTSDEIYHERYLAWYKNNERKIHNFLLSNMLGPFRYARALGGHEANDYFGDEYTEYVLQVAKIEKRIILVAEKI